MKLRFLPIYNININIYFNKNALFPQKKIKKLNNQYIFYIKIKFYKLDINLNSKSDNNTFQQN